MIDSLGLCASLDDNARNDGGIIFQRTVLALLNAEWQRRRIVCSKATLYFSLLEDDVIRDKIPLDEICAVEIMGESKQPTLGRIESYMSQSMDARNDFGSSSSPENLDSDNFMLQTAFQVRTTATGYNSGRTYYFQTDSREMRDSVIDEIRALSVAAKIRVEGASRFVQSQSVARRIYNSLPFQAYSALLVLANFALSVTEAQIDSSQNSEGYQVPAAANNPRATATDSAFTRADLALTLLFAAELALNAYAHWLRPFLSSGWSLLDLFILLVSIVSLALVGIPLRLVLLLRCCRVLRIFGKLPSVAKIFSALFQSLVPMTNAFFIIFTIAAVYAVVGVAFLAQQAPEQFGDFGRAFVSMFRITLGSLDWWFDVFDPVQDERLANSSQFFFLISYVILVNWVFFQVSIAVLLDNFLNASAAMKAAEHKKRIQERSLAKHFKNPLDPLLLRLSKDYVNEADLSSRLNDLFKVLDSDGSGDLSSLEFQAAMKKLDVTPRIFISDSDFVAITKDGELCNTRGHLGPSEFSNVMREQLRLYSQQRLSSTSEFWTVSDEDFTELGSLKQILFEMLAARTEQERNSKRLAELLNRLPVSGLAPPIGCNEHSSLRACICTLSGASSGSGIKPFQINSGSFASGDGRTERVPRPSANFEPQNPGRPQMFGGSLSNFSVCYAEKRPSLEEIDPPEDNYFCYGKGLPIGQKASLDRKPCICDERYPLSPSSYSAGILGEHSNSIFTDQDARAATDLVISCSQKGEACDLRSEMVKDVATIVDNCNCQRQPDSGVREEPSALHKTKTIGGSREMEHFHKDTAEIFCFQPAAYAFSTSETSLMPYLVQSEGLPATAVFGDSEEALLQSLPDLLCFSSPTSPSPHIDGAAQKVFGTAIIINSYDKDCMNEEALWRSGNSEKVVTSSSQMVAFCTSFRRCSQVEVDLGDESKQYRKQPESNKQQGSMSKEMDQWNDLSPLCEPCFSCLQKSSVLYADLRGDGISCCYNSDCSAMSQKKVRLNRQPPLESKLALGLQQQRVQDHHETNVRQQVETIGAAEVVRDSWLMDQVDRAAPAGLIELDARDIDILNISMPRHYSRSAGDGVRGWPSHSLSHRGHAKLCRLPPAGICISMQQAQATMDEPCKGNMKSMNNQG